MGGECTTTTTTAKTKEEEEEEEEEDEECKEVKCRMSLKRMGCENGWATDDKGCVIEKDRQCECAKPDDSTTDSKGCMCPKDWRPVCGNNDKTYSNGCAANCEEVTVQYEGACTTTTTTTAYECPKC